MLSQLWLLLLAAGLNLGYSYCSHQPRSLLKIPLHAVEKKFLSFADIKSLKSLNEQYKPSTIDTKLAQSFSDCRYIMTQDALKIIAGCLAQELAFVALENDKSRYFIVYEIIKAISRLGNRLSITVVDTGAVVNELMGEEQVSLYANEYRMC